MCYLMETVKEQFGELPAEIEVSEIAAMEKSLMSDGVPQEETQHMCDVHAAVLDARCRTTRPTSRPATLFSPVGSRTRRPSTS